MVVSAQRSHVGEQVSVGSRNSATQEHGAGRTGAVTPCAWRHCLVRVLRATTWILLAAFLCNGAWAKSPPPQRRGKVIIIRGAFTVFSLGMNELGEKLAQYGLDVEVVADISAGRAASNLKSEIYRRKQNIGPIVFIGHSRGADTIGCDCHSPKLFLACFNRPYQPPRGDIPNPQRLIEARRNGYCSVDR